MHLLGKKNDFLYSQKPFRTFFRETRPRDALGTRKTAVLEQFFAWICRQVFIVKSIYMVAVCPCVEKGSYSLPLSVTTTSMMQKVSKFFFMSTLKNYRMSYWPWILYVTTFLQFSNRSLIISPVRFLIWR